MVSDPRVGKGSDHRGLVGPTAHRTEGAGAVVTLSWQWQESHVAFLQEPVHLGGLANGVDRSIHAI